MIAGPPVFSMFLAQAPFCGAGLVRAAGRAGRAAHDACHRSLCTACVGILLVLSGQAVAESVYKITDASGRVTYSGTPPTDGSAFEILRIQATMGVAGGGKASPSKQASQSASNAPAPKPAAIVAGRESTTDARSESLSAGTSSGNSAGSAPGGGGGSSAGGNSVGAGGGQTSRSTPATATSTNSQPTGGTTFNGPKPPPVPPKPAAPPPPPAPVVESGDLEANCALDAYGVSEPKMVPPIVYVSDFGAKGDGITDDSDAINRALESMNSGGTLVFNPSRVYLKRKHIVVRKPGIRLWGYGAILYSYLTPEQIDADNGPDEHAFSAQISLQLRAPGTSVYGLTFISNLRARLVGTQAHAGVLLTSQMHEVIDNRFEYTQNGVRVRGASFEAPASEFVIARNVVYRTTADAITVMTNSTNGRVLCNVVRENGDDMISVLDYGLGEPDDVWKILIEGNDLAGTYKGRGITVHGGRDVTIRGNTVAQTTRNAGIMIRGGPDTYEMANVRNVLVEDNMIKDIQTTLPVYSPLPDWKRTGQGAIDIAGYGELSDVVVRNNTIQSTGYDGILIRGNAERIGLFANRLYNVGTTPIDVQARSGTITCLENVYNDAYVSSSACSSTAIPTVTGAQM